MATYLTGRHPDYVLFPFSFKEYLEFRGVKIVTGSGRAMELIKRAKAIYVNEYGRILGSVSQGFRQVILTTTDPDPAKRPSIRKVMGMLEKI
ncbi:hypothetical protein [Metallosphaera tengchongensis]|uniref:hypothetical protein n=1 Tax=Metallosphaera tengchongensis TaxID=1532350 RepID=UPI001FE43D7F|nr:hypothetical protein [Metallosphaera tengchongensis]